MYRPLGTGDVDVAAIVGSPAAHGYNGWYMLEQDTILTGEPGVKARWPTCGPAPSIFVRSFAGPDDGRPAAGTAADRRPGRGPDRCPRHRRTGPHHWRPPGGGRRPRSAPGRGLRRPPRGRAGAGHLRRGGGRPRGRGRLQPARQRPPRALEPGSDRRGEARAERETVRQQRRRGPRGPRRRHRGRRDRAGGLPLPLPPGDPPPAQAAGHRRAGPAASRRGRHGHPRARRRRPALVAGAGRRRDDGPRLLQPTRPPDAGPLGRRPAPGGRRPRRRAGRPPWRR